MKNGVIFKVDIDKYLKMALAEDITWGDVSTEAVTAVDDGKSGVGSVELIAKAEGIICGLDVFFRVFQLLDENVNFETQYQDGDTIKKGSLIGTLHGNVGVLLSAERTALNYLQRMSGIATMTAKYAEILKPYKTKLLDTRKTTPNMRIFEKYAVRVGGGTNHRFNLSDGVMLKDNHINAAGGVANAVKLARENSPFVRKIEVETETLEMVREALDACADIIMLDNMDDDTMKRAVALIGGRTETECSGNIIEKRLKKIGEIGIDYVSCGVITYGAPILDLSMKNLRRK